MMSNIFKNVVFSGQFGPQDFLIFLGFEFNNAAHTASSVSDGHIFICNSFNRQFVASFASTILQHDIYGYPFPKTKLNFHRCEIFNHVFNK